MTQEECNLFQDLSLFFNFLHKIRPQVQQNEEQNNCSGQASMKKGSMEYSNLFQRFMNRGKWHALFLYRSTEFLGFSFLRGY